jgi:hypothetical protein
MWKPPKRPSHFMGEICTGALKPAAYQAGIERKQQNATGLSHLDNFAVDEHTAPLKKLKQNNSDSVNFQISQSGCTASGCTKAIVPGKVFTKYRLCGAIPIFIMCTLSILNLFRCIS